MNTSYSFLIDEHLMKTIQAIEAKIPKCPKHEIKWGAWDEAIGAATIDLEWVQAGLSA